MALACLAVACGMAAVLAPAARAGQPAIDQRFTDPTNQFLFANGLMQRNAYEEAAREFALFLERYPGDARLPQAVLGRAECLFALKQYAAAAPLYYRYVTMQGERDRLAVARLRYGSCLHELGQDEGAVKALRPLVGRPADAGGSPPPAAANEEDGAARRTANYYIGLSLARLGKHAEAIPYLARVREGELAPLAMQARAQSLAATGRAEAAAALFQRVARDYPDHALALEARLGAAGALRAAGHIEPAALIYKDLARESALPEEARVRVLLGQSWIRLKREDPRGAGRLAAEALAVARASASGSNGADGATADRDAKGASASWAAWGEEARYLSGLAHFAAKDFPKARAVLLTVRRKDLMASALRHAAWAAYLEEKPDEALRILPAWRSAAPEEAAEADYLAGRASLAKKDLEGAIRFLRRAGDRPGERQVAAIYELALALEGAGRAKEAAEAYARYGERFPKGPHALDAVIGRARALMSMNAYEAALPLYVRLAKDGAAMPEQRANALAQQAVCYYWLRQYDNMARCYRELLDNPAYAATPPGIEAIYWLAWYAQSEKRYDDAIRRYETLLQDHPRHALAPKARYRMAMCHYQAGRHDAAAALLHAVVTRHGEPDLEEDELLWLGQHLLRTRKLAEAEEVFQTLLKRQPRGRILAIGLFQQAEVKRLRERWAGALEAYRALLATVERLRREGATDQGGALSGLLQQGRYGEAVSLRHLGRLAEARAALDRIQLAPQDPFRGNLLFERGQLAFAENRYAEAADFLMRVGLLYDDEALAGEALLLAAKACLAVENRKKARLCLEELAGAQEKSFGQRYPESPFATEGRRMLKALDADRPAGAAPNAPNADDASLGPRP